MASAYGAVCQIVGSASSQELLLPRCTHGAHEGRWLRVWMRRRSKQIDSPSRVLPLRDVLG